MEQGYALLQSRSSARSSRRGVLPMALSLPVFLVVGLVLCPPSRPSGISDLAWLAAVSGNLLIICLALGYQQHSRLHPAAEPGTKSFLEVWLILDICANNLVSVLCAAKAGQAEAVLFCLLFLVGPLGLFLGSLGPVFLRQLPNLRWVIAILAGFWGTTVFVQLKFIGQRSTADFDLLLLNLPLLYLVAVCISAWANTPLRPPIAHGR